MQFKTFPSIIAFAIATLIAYAFYSFASTRSNLLLLMFGSGITIFVSLIGCLGISTNDSRATTNIRIVSSILLLLMLISNFIFSYFDFSAPLYIITIGLFVLFAILAIYGILKSLN